MLTYAIASVIMEPDETVLSDIHIGMSRTHSVDRTGNVDNVKYAGYVTRFLFALCSYEDQYEDDNNRDSHAMQSTEGRCCYLEGLCTSDDCEFCPFQLCSSEHVPSAKNGSDCCVSRNKHSVEHVYDDDGDLIVKRKLQQQFEIIYIEHTLATHLCDVGLQVWAGCMYLCDFVIHQQQMFDKAIVLELGAGVGLASIVASMFADRIFATDVGDEVLEMCRRNVYANKHLQHLHSGSVHVRELDWMQPDLRADVIYSDELTDAYFNTVKSILTKKTTSTTVILSLERRLNFTLADLDVSCAAYTYFKQCLEQLEQLMTETNRNFTAQLVDNIPQYFSYERSKYLELWLFSVCDSATSSSAKPDD